MKKLFICFIALLSMLFVTSCEKDNSELVKKVYFQKTMIYGADSTYSGITVYVGYVNEHKFLYHVFNGGKHKGEVIPYHMTSECKKCSGKNVSKK